MQNFFKSYLTISLRVLAYLSGSLFFGIVDGFAKHVLPTSSVRWLLFFVLNIIEFEIAGVIIARIYHPHLPKNLEPGSPDYESRVSGEKMICQLSLFFAFDLILAIIVAALGFNPPSLQYWFWGIIGLPVAMAHFFGTAIMAAGFSDANPPEARRQAKLTGFIFLLPGLAYAVISLLILFPLWTFIPQ